MKHQTGLSDLIRVVSKSSLDWNDDKTAKLGQFYKSLNQATQRVSLVSKKTQHHIISRHFLLSFIFAEYLYIGKNKTPRSIVDLGSGNGFPAVVLAICFEKSLMTLVDSNRKKILFLKKIKKELNLNYNIIHDRIENWSPEKLNVDIITALAFAPLKKAVQVCKDFILTGSKLVTIKGENYLDEINKIPDNILIKPYPIKKHWINYNPDINDKLIIEVMHST